MVQESNVQDEMLRVVKKNKALVTVYLNNGLQLKGIVKAFDKFVVLLDYEEKQQMIYKHSIMMLRPMKRVDLKLNEEVL